MNTKLYIKGLLLMASVVFTSCSDIEIPEHNLDVEFRYELTCSDAFLKYATPQVTITVCGQGLSTKHGLIVFIMIA